MEIRSSDWDETLESRELSQCKSIQDVHCLMFGGLLAPYPLVSLNHINDPTPLTPL